MTQAVKTTDSSDSELVTRSLAGNRDAFGGIVARYQSLLCSLAYSATGSLSQSEDLAQETFITAWKQLAELREPQKFYDAVMEREEKSSTVAEGGVAFPHARTAVVDQLLLGIGRSKTGGAGN